MYTIRRINHKASEYRTLYTCSDRTMMWDLFEQEVDNASENDIVIVIETGNPGYPDPYAILHYEDGIVYRHIFAGKRTFLEEIKNKNYRYA